MLCVSLDYHDCPGVAGSLVPVVFAHNKQIHSSALQWWINP